MTLGFNALSIKKVVQKLFFVIRVRWLNKIFNLSDLYYSLQGMKIGRKVSLINVYITWPHQVSIGDNCILEHQIYFKYDGIWSEGPSIIIENNVFIGSSCEFNIRKRIVIGKNSLIASGCKFIDHDHGIKLGELMREQVGVEDAIVVEENVWLGANVIVLKGVTIGEGAIVAAGAVVNKSIPPNEIWAGIPAKKINQRS